MRLLLSLGLMAVAGAFGCRKSPERHLVEHVRVELVGDASAHGLDGADLEALFHEKLGAHGGFEVGTAPPRAERPSISLELAVAEPRPAMREDASPLDVEVAVAVAARTRPDKRRYDVEARSESRAGGDGLEARKDASRRALSKALEEAIARLHFRLLAAKRNDRELLADLAANDGRIRDAAIRELAERKNPGAADALIERLASDDVDEVREAIGMLVELRETRAVPAIIDVARARHPSFVREVIFALSAIGGDEAEAYLYTVAQGHDQPAVREAAQEALDELSLRKKDRAERPRREENGP